MTSYIPQQLFNMCAISVAKISAAKKQPIEAVAAQLAESYARSYDDASLQEDIASAAVQISTFIQGVLPPDTLVGNLTQMQFCIKNYSTNGKKWPPKLFGGTWFNKERAPLVDKVNQCAADIATYHVLTVSGAIPLAPESWRL